MDIIRLIASDLDATLLDDQSQLPPDFAEAVRALTERGIREANRLYTACALLKAYFTEYLEVDSETARADAVNCLCCLSERSLAQIEGKVLEERGCTA